MLKQNFKFIVLYLSCFMASFSYGFIYILPVIVKNLGGDTVDVGLILSYAGLAALMVVGFSGRLSHFFGAGKICSAGLLCNFLGFLIIYKMQSLGPSIYLAGLLLGTGWSLYYAASPMIITPWVSDVRRGQHLGLMAAFVVLGTGLGPCLGQALLLHGASIKNIYLIPLFLSFLSASLFYIQAGESSAPRAMISKVAIKSEKQAFRIFKILKSEARYPLAMVFLGACMLSAMMNFQTVYADEQQLNFSVYYFSYMSAVVLSRFLFGNFLSRKNPLAATPLLLLLMILGLALLLINHHNPLFYAASALSLGLSYGLVYPLIKTQAVNITPQHERQEVLAYFTLSYFLGMYGFPLIAGFVIKAYGFTALFTTLIVLVALDCFIGWRGSKRVGLT